MSTKKCLSSLKFSTLMDTLLFSVRLSSDSCPGILTSLGRRVVRRMATKYQLGCVVAEDPFVSRTTDRTDTTIIIGVRCVLERDFRRWLRPAMLVGRMILYFCCVVVGDGCCCRRRLHIPICSSPFRVLCMSSTVVLL